MGHSGISSTEARRRVRIAQFAGIGVGVLAAALWAMNVPGLTPTLPQKPVISDTGSGGNAPAVVQVVRIDSAAPSAIGERLDVAANRPPATTEAPRTTPPVAPPAEATATPWKYLGTIQESARMLALVSVQGMQKIVSEGSMVKITTPASEGRPETVDYSATVVRIARDHLMIKEESGAQRRVDLETKTASVAWVKNMHAPRSGAPSAVAAGGLTPEARQRLIAQGIDPAAAERARQAAIAAGRNRGTPGAEAGAAAAAAAANQRIEMKDDGSKPALNGMRARAVPAADADSVGADDDGTKADLSRMRTVN